MRKSSAFALIGLIVILLFSAGVIRLFARRFSTGDTYPHYSSLRNDPLGTRVLYEALEGCCGFRVSRNFQSYRHIGEQTDGALLILGIPFMSAEHMDKRSVHDLTTFVQNGGRLVIALYPARREDPFPDAEKERTQETNIEGFRDSYVPLCKAWGFAMKYKPRETATASQPSASPDSSLPQSISCRTDLVLEASVNSWHTVFERDGNPVVMEREFGKGTIVLSALSYFLSNEAMIKERHPSMLLWLSGSKAKIIFDEYSHGIARAPGVAALGRKYHLEWFLGGVAVLALLFVWRNAASFLPPHLSGPGAEPAPHGKDQVDALTNLLRRNIVKTQVLGACYNEWAKSLGREAEESKQRIQKVEQLIHQAPGGAEKSAVDVYNAISEMLQRRT